MPEINESDLQRIIPTFLTARKVGRSPLAWKTKSHADYCESKFPVTCDDFPTFNSVVMLQAHKSRTPRKYLFQIMIDRLPIFRLDVNPARSHFNISTGVSVNQTHWQTWPTMEAEPEIAERSHRGWFGEFLRRANICYDGRYDAPPYQDPQMPLL